MLYFILAIVSKILYEKPELQLFKVNIIKLLSHMWGRQVGLVRGNAGGWGGKQEVLEAGENVKTCLLHMWVLPSSEATSYSIRVCDFRY